MSLTIVPFLVTTTGGAGVATGNAYPEFNDTSGYIMAFATDDDNAPATCDFELKQVTPDGTEVQLFKLDNYTSPQICLPQIATVKATDGTASGQYAHIPYTGRLHLYVTGANAGIVKAWLIVEESR